MIISSLICFIFSKELLFGIPGENKKETAMMERGMQKLTNSTPQLNNLGSRISGVQSTTTRIKQDPNDFLFGMSSNDQKKHLTQLWVDHRRIGSQSTLQQRSRMTTYVIGKVW